MGDDAILNKNAEQNLIDEEFAKAFNDLTGEDLVKSEDDDLDFEALLKASKDEDEDEEENEEEEEEEDEDEEGMGKSELNFSENDLVKSIDAAFDDFGRHQDKKLKKELNALRKSIGDVFKTLHKKIEVMAKSVEEIAQQPQIQKAKTYEYITKSIGVVEDGKEPESFNKSEINDALGAAVYAHDITHAERALIPIIERKVNRNEVLSKSEVTFLQKYGLGKGGK